MRPHHADEIIDDVTVLTPGGGSLSDAAVAIADGRIVAVGPSVEINARWAAPEVIDGRSGVLGPGLIDAHTHLALSLARALPSLNGHPVYDVFWPLERCLDEDLVHAFARASAAEALLAGVTTVADHYFFADASVAATTEVGLRSVVGQSVLRNDGPWHGEQSLGDAIDFAERHRTTSLVHPAIAPHALDTVGDEWIVAAAAAARAMDVPVHLHVAQSEREVEAVARRSGRTPIAQLTELGVLDQRTIAAHCMYATDDDLEILAAHPLVHPIYCPTVHAGLGKVLRASWLHERGVTIGLGTDAVPNERFDVLAEVRAAWSHQRVLASAEQRESSLTLDDVLTVATESNAEALGLGAVIGRIEPGYAADVVLWRTDRAVAAGAGDARRFVAGVCGPDLVDTVWVNGRRVVMGSVLVSTSEQMVAHAANVARAELFRRADLT